jgi:hypothetical protein
VTKSREQYDFPPEFCQLGDELLKRVQALFSEFTDEQPDDMVPLQTVLWTIGRLSGVALSSLLDETDRREARAVLVSLIDFHVAEQLRHDKLHGTVTPAVKIPRTSPTKPH